MVKSKFPGKPSKFNNRKLVNVSNAANSTQENESARAAEFICYGLSVFNETFGPDDDESAPFHGFSPYDIARSKELAETRLAEIEKEYKSRGVAFLPLNKKIQNKSLLLPESFVNSSTNECNFECDESHIDRPFTPIKHVAGSNLKKNRTVTSSVLVKNNFFEFSSDSRSSGGISNLQSNSDDKRFFINSNNTAASSDGRNIRNNFYNSNNNTQDKTVIGVSNNPYYKKNFILPSRSARSSRVIKPNKRFLDRDSDVSICASGGSGSSSSSVASGYDCNEQLGSDQTLATTSCGIKLKKPRLVLGPGQDDPNFTWSRSRRDDSTIVSDVESETSSLKSSSVSSTSGSSTSGQTKRQPPPKTKIVLRKSRLNIETPLLPDVSRPKSGAVRGKVVCGVCGATRFYRFVRQARKFGIYSCESCRKFISKMINTHDKTPLKCYGEGGQCTVPPVLRTVIWEVRKQMISKVRKMRCPACWLKMCIRCYCMPDILKVRLNKLLPVFMRDPILSAKNVHKLPTGRRLRKKYLHDTSSSTNIENETKEELKSVRRARLENRLNKKLKLNRKCRSESSSNINDTKIRRRRRRSKLKQQDDDSDATSSNKSEEDKNPTRGRKVVKEKLKAIDKRHSTDINLNKTRVIKSKLNKDRFIERKHKRKLRRQKRRRKRKRRKDKERELKRVKKAKQDEDVNEKNKINAAGTSSTLDDALLNEDKNIQTIRSENPVVTHAVQIAGEKTDKLLLISQTSQLQSELLPKVSSLLETNTQISKTISSPLKYDASIIKCDEKPEETAVVPFVPKKRGRKKKVPGDIKPPMKEIKPVVGEIRQKRKAALNSLANIARVTGRVTEFSVENQLIVARNLKKKAAAIARREAAVIPFERKNEGKEISNVGMKRKRKEKQNQTGLLRNININGSGRSSSSVPLQGPRVKHVCRSASLVLGRQVATFNTNVPVKPQLKELSVIEPVKVAVLPSSDALSTNSVPFETTDLQTAGTQKTESPPLPPSSSVLLQSSTSTSVSLSLPSTPSTSGGGRIRQPSNDVIHNRDKDDVVLNSKGKPKTYARTLQDLGRQNCELLDGVSSQSEDVSVSIDFWETYDPEEVGKTGFALIGSDSSFRVPSLCFLCGSAGADKLIHCACCCEPYHMYCVEGGMKDLKKSQFWWRVDWVCPRCIICNTCGKGDGPHVSCHRCRKSYHMDCLPHDRITNRAHSSDRPWVCHSCIRCKSCNAKSVSVFVGNIPLCNSCFKLRQKGSYCPICQKCYDDNDFDTKMMECGKCNSWVHARCEGLSNEKYQVLSFLPDSVEFICQICCKTPPAPWWLAVEAELNAGYLNVLKSLTKNRKACELLKWSPKKQLVLCSCHNNLSPSSRNQHVISSHSMITLPQHQNLPENFVVDQHELPSTARTSTATTTATTITTTSTSTENFKILKERLTAGDARSDNFINDSSSSSSSSSLSSLFLSSCSNREESKEDECLQKNLVNIPLSGESSNSNCLNILSRSKPNDINLVNVVESSKPDKESDTVNNNVSCDIKTKFNVKDCTVSLKNCIASSPSASEELHVKLNDNDQQMLLPMPPYQSLEGKAAQFSPHATSQSDSGIGSTDDELKPSSSVDDNEIVINNGMVGEEVNSSSLKTQVSSLKQCHCFGFDNLTKTSPSLLYIKNKINGKKYSSLYDFHKDMQHVVESVQGNKLMDIYYHILQDIFPWFDPKYSQVFDSSRNDSNLQNKTNMNVNMIEAETNEETADYYEDSSVVLKDHLGLSRDYYYYNVNFKDNRICVLCKSIGDGPSEEEGRLLYCGHNEWIHANCALWSNEVFEEIDGSLQRVHSAISRSRLIRCAFCGKRGASVGCCYRNCPESYHFPCAKIGSCVFMEDKSIYCNLHQNESKSKPLNKDSDFAITRPIYVELVELEKKKKKFVPHHQVRVMVGSLSVESLGEFVSDVSDQEVSIIPCDFVCTRLFWSTYEPWRLVRYHIRTKVIQSSHDYLIEDDDNFTVDHSLDTKSNQLISDDNKSTYSQQNTTAKIPEVTDTEIKQVLNNLLDIVCANNKDDDKSEEALGNLSDPQNPADLLPPELKDAIFEDLPHDILDGISMQDIFPKLMSYDDIGEKNDKFYTNLDSNADIIGNNNLLLKKKKLKLDDTDFNNLSRKSLNSKYSNKSDNTVVDNLKQQKLFIKNSLSVNDDNKKPKAVVKPDINKTLLDKKLHCNNDDDSKGKVVKQQSSDWKNSTILQVDGAVDYNSGDSDIGSPGTKSNNDIEQKTSICNPVLFVTIQDSNPINKLDVIRSDGNVKLHRLLQVDGCADSSGESEIGNISPRSNYDDYENSDTDSFYFNYNEHKWKCVIPQLDGASDCNINENKDTDEKPVKCSRCHRTYRTAVSYERHLPTCNTDYILSCSESDSSEEEKASSPVNEYCPSVISNGEFITTTSDMIDSSSSSTISADSASANSECNDATDTCTSSSLVEPNSDFCQGAEDVVEYVVQTLESTDGVQESTCINSALYKEDDCDQNEQGLYMYTAHENHLEKINDDENKNTTECIIQSPIICNNTNDRTIECVETIEDSRHIKNVNILGSRHKKVNEQTTTILLQQQQSHILDFSPQFQPAIIVPVPTQQNIVPVIGTFPQQATTLQPTQNIQYVTIDSVDKSSAQYQTAVLSNAYQIPSQSPTVQTVAFVGTIVSSPSSIDQQLILNANHTNNIDIFGQQPGSVYIQSPQQPVLLSSMETVVSNTVMSQSQFSVPGSVPGMLSTYSTTTQVIQATKQPMLDIMVIPPVNNTSTAVDNAMQPVNVSFATNNQLQQVQQEQNHWYRYPQQQQQQCPDTSLYKINEKTAVVRQIMNKQNSTDFTGKMVSLREKKFFEPTVISSNKSNAHENDQLKIVQNAKKIGPVHHLAQMVSNIQSSAKKICLNSPPTKQKPPEAKVMPQPKVNVTQQQSPFRERVFHKKMNCFPLNKPSNTNNYNNVNSSISKKIIDDVITKAINNNNNDGCDNSKDKTNIDDKMSNISCSSPPPKKNVDVKNDDICANRFINEPNDKSFVNRQKVIVEPVIPVKDNSPGNSLNVNTENKIRTYINPKKKTAPIIPSQPTAQVKEQLKSQIWKDFVSRNNFDDCNNSRVLQPTLKENKILECKMKARLHEKITDTNNCMKRIKHFDKRINESCNVNRREVTKAAEKVINGKQKVEKLKRKDNTDSLNLDEKVKHVNENSSSKNTNSLPNMVFEINSEDGFTHSADNIVDGFNHLFKQVQKARASYKLPPLPRNPYQSADALLKMLGLGNNSVKYMIEQLPGVGRSVKYHPVYHKNRHQFVGCEFETRENPSGCARTEPYVTRNKYDMFSWLASRHRRPPNFLVTSDTDIVNGNSRRATSLNLPMAMRFRHLRETSKEAVGVFRSDIHGRGLFCLRDIDSGEMVIEYAGEVIRSALTDKRERYYTSKGIGCYMFRIDDNFVVDATMKGNAARFINHSCEPNCYSRVVDILGKKHILIFALRRIPQGEELTYDYKFPLEDDKITCHCLSRKCRKYLN
ncbi:histone lysine N-methyltransferase trithorax [Lycorma delicatula]|uniref:histone lysine N-methyltransferase trithorax n=1 Tax=Lycorma delicatula TaxID=130591 RepID=UPI003F518D1A